MKKRKLLLWIFIAGFITNLVWENLQAPLYEGHESFSQHFLFCVAASVVDGATIVVFYVLIGLIRRNIFWLFNIGIKDIVIIVILGTITAIAFEIVALKKETWNYKQNMPLVFGLGFIPLTQLSTLSIVSIYVIKYIIQAKQKPNQIKQF